MMAATPSASSTLIVMWEMCVARLLPHAGAVGGGFLRDRRAKPIGDGGKGACYDAKFSAVQYMYVLLGRAALGALDVFIKAAPR